MTISLTNPHSILAVLESRPQDILQATFSKTTGKNSLHGIWDRVFTRAKENGIQIKEGPGTGSFLVRERKPISMEDFFSKVKETGKDRGLWLALDSIQDPHNIGAIFRTAAFFGVNGILLSEARSAPVSAVVYDVSCGGVEYVPFSIATNLARALELAKEAGLWVLGTSEHAKLSIEEVKADRPWLLVLGGEGKGMRRLVGDMCDMTCSVPARGQVGSLNVSVAAGVLISRLV
ncbi:MAG: 23S rRNA (guanosine(2251)-2'-O)-methyltransferase RlmB [Bdellovibrionota bacterium]